MLFTSDERYELLRIPLESSVVRFDVVVLCAPAPTVRCRRPLFRGGEEGGGMVKGVVAGQRRRSNARGIDDLLPEEIGNMFGEERNAPVLEGSGHT